MTVAVIREQEVLREAMDVLWKHLGPAKAVRLWATWQMGEGDYLSLRSQLFEGERVATLFEKVQVYQDHIDKAARIQAEEQACQEAAARAEVEARLRALEAELRCLRGKG